LLINIYLIKCKKIAERGMVNTKVKSTQSIFGQLYNMLRTMLRGNSRSVALLQRASYHQNVIDHYENPRNVGRLDAKSPTVGTGVVGAPACGDVMKLQIRVENDVIVEAKFKTYGCGSAIASSSLATEWLIGKSVDKALEIRDKEIAAHLSLPPIKLHCSMLAEDAIRAAVHDFRNKSQHALAKE
jgi:Fe-S cluster assembly scaffold IscU